MRVDGSTKTDLVALAGEEDGSVADTERSFLLLFLLVDFLLHNAVSQGM